MRLERLHVRSIEASEASNPRKVIRGIRELADSIAEVGLLENLVVRPKGPDEYLLAAGARRHRAIQLLTEEGRHDGIVHCLVIETDGEFEALAENEGHQSVLPWETGDRLNELSERGFEQKEIALKIGTTQQRISQYMRIAQGLGEKARHILSKMPAAVNVQQLLQIAALTDSYGNPDEGAQVRKIDDILSRPRKRKKRTRRDMGGLNLREHLFVRYKTLKYHITVPANVRSQIDAVLRYMDGTDDKLDLGAWGMEKF